MPLPERPGQFLVTPGFRRMTRISKVKVRVRVRLRLVLLLTFYTAFKRTVTVETKVDISVEITGVIHQGCSVRIGVRCSFNDRDRCVYTCFRVGTNTF